MKGIIDRIEDNNMAVVQLEQGGEILISVDSLPEGSKESDILEISICIDESATAERKRRIAEKQSGLKTE